MFPTIDTPKPKWSDVFKKGNNIVVVQNNVISVKVWEKFQDFGSHPIFVNEQIQEG